MYNLKNRSRNDDNSYSSRRGIKDRKTNFSFEIQAAETLACLAQSYSRRSEDRDSNHQSPSGVDYRSDHCGPRNQVTPPPVEAVKGLTRPHSGRKVVHQLFQPTSDDHRTPTDKQAKRWRRVLANRESARKTIRRRQQEFDELVEKAKTLEIENEEMREQKEEVLRHMQILKESNENLKKKMVELNIPLKVKQELESEPEPEPETEPEQEPEPEPTAAQLFPPNPMHVPTSWHSLIQSSLQQFRSPYAIPSMCRYNYAGTSATPVPNIPMGGAFLYVLQPGPNAPQPQLNDEHSSSSSTPTINRGNEGTSSITGEVNVNLELRCYGEEEAGAANAANAVPVPEPAMTPAQARKRRRESMKLKKLRLGQFTMN